MRRMLILGALALLPGCALADGDINLNANTDDTTRIANAIGFSGLPICLREDEEDWSDISD